jgi:nicotinate-nucleotide adenylyltransferase
VTEPFGATPGRALPPWTPGLRIGLFGGSFNPPHAGHRLASLTALRRLELDRIWWIVTPGNPLKRTGGQPDLETRMAAARTLARHPRIAVTGIEALIGTRYTVDTVAYLMRRCRGVRFVWIMGADNLLQLPRWRRWRELIDLIPIAAVDRPGDTLRAVHGPAGAILGRRRLDESDACLLADQVPPAFVYLHGPRSHASSTALRDAGLGLRPHRS